MKASTINSNCWGYIAGIRSDSDVPAPSKKKRKQKESSHSDSDENDKPSPSTKPKMPLKIALKPTTPEKTKKKKETNVQKLIKKRSLPKAHHTPTQPAVSSGDRCMMCYKRREKWTEEMPHNCVYCSPECIQKTVLKAKSVIRNVEEKLMLIEKGTGAVHNGPSAPNVTQLESFLESHPSFYPVLPERKEEIVECHVRSAPVHPHAHQHNELRRAPTAVAAPDRKRLEARRILKEVLVDRANQAEDVLMTEAEVRLIAIRIEEELFKACGNSVSVKYKNWYRAALTNLKSLNNKGLFRRLLSGEISPAKAAHLTPEELASKVMSKWDGSELVLDDDMLSTGNQGNKKKPVAIVKAQDPITDIFGLLVRDTTGEHKSHLFDLNCKICTGKQQPENEERERRKKMKTDRKQREKNASSPPPVPVSRVSPIEQGTPRDTPANWSPTFRRVQAPITNTHQEQYDDDEYGAPDDDEPGSPIAHATPATPAGSRTPLTPSQISTHQHSDKRAHTPETQYCWTGNVSMSSYFQFPCTSVLLSGSNHIDIAADLPDILNIVGRIPPGVVWSYLQDIRKTNSKYVFVLYLVPPDDPQQRQQYDGLYENMRKKERFCVIGKNIDPNKIKDCYVFPLAKEEHAPEELQVQHGPGFPANRPNLIIVMIVSHRALQIDKVKSVEQVLSEQPNDNVQQQAEEIEENYHGRGPRTPDETFNMPNYSPTQVPVSSLPRGVAHDRAEMRSIIYGGMGLAQQDHAPRNIPTERVGENVDVSLRPLVSNLLHTISTGDQEPAQVATMVSRFLEEHDLSEDEQKYVLEALNQCVSKHQDKLEQDDGDEPYEPGEIGDESVSQRHTNRVDTPQQEQRGVEAVGVDDSPIESGEQESRDQFYDWMMKRMVSAMDAPNTNAPAPHTQPCKSVSVDMDIEESGEPSAVASSRETGLLLPPPPMAPPIPPDNQSPIPPPPDGQRFEAWGRGGGWNEPPAPRLRPPPGEWGPDGPPPPGPDWRPDGHGPPPPGPDWRPDGPPPEEWGPDGPPPPGDWNRRSPPPRDWRHRPPPREWQEPPPDGWDGPPGPRGPAGPPHGEPWGDHPPRERWDDYGPPRGRRSPPPHRRDRRGDGRPRPWDRPRVDYADVNYDDAPPHLHNRGPTNRWQDVPNDLMEWAEEPAEFGVPAPRGRGRGRPYRGRGRGRGRY